MLVDLLRLAVLLQEPAQHAHPPDPEHLDRHARLLGALPFAVASVASLRRAEGAAASRFAEARFPSTRRPAARPPPRPRGIGERIGLALRFASAHAFVLARECTFCGFWITKPSFTSLRMFWPAAQQSTRRRTLGRCSTDGSVSRRRRGEGAERRTGVRH